MASWGLENAPLCLIEEGQCPLCEIWDDTSPSSPQFRFANCHGYYLYLGFPDRKETKNELLLSRGTIWVPNGGKTSHSE